jgi:apolipoprotein N-acyltransferase
MSFSRRTRIIELSLLVFGLIFAALAFPAKKAWFGILAWISFVPLINLNEKLETKQGLLVNWLFFFILFLSLFYINPMVETRRFEDSKAIFLLTILFIFGPIACASIVTLAKLTAAKFSTYLRPCIYAGIWVSFEYLLTLIPNGFPLSIAITQASNPYLLQLVPFLGIYGISFLLMGINSSLAIFWHTQKKEILLIAIITFLLNFTYGFFILSLSHPPANLVKIGLVQPNISWERSLYSRRNFFLNISLNQLYELSNKVKKLDSPSLIVWPELSADCYLLQTYSYHIEKCAKELKIPLLIGTYFYDHENKKPTNVAALISDSGNTIGMYKKQILFPFTETSEYQKGKWEESYPLTFDRATINNIGAMLCFESLYPQISIKLTKEGANVLLLLANSAWFGNTRWPWLHMSYIVFRALETNRWAVHLNNTGPSVVVSSQGILGENLPQAKSAVAVAKVVPKEELSFYIRTNELFPKIVLAFSLSVIFLPKFFEKGGDKTGIFSKLFCWR